jgi:hypothetical protein
LHGIFFSKNIFFSTEDFRVVEKKVIDFVCFNLTEIASVPARHPPLAYSELAGNTGIIIGGVEATPPVPLMRPMRMIEIRDRGKVP